MGLWLVEEILKYDSVLNSLPIFLGIVNRSVLWFITFASHQEISSPKPIIYAKFSLNLFES
jgi:hypothetical protein